MKYIVALLLLLSAPAYAGSTNNPANASSITGTLLVPSGGTGAMTLGGGLFPRPITQGLNPAVAVTLSNLGQTTTSITNPNIYKFITGGPTAPVIDTTHFNYFCNQPVMSGGANPNYNQIAGFGTDQSGFGTVCVEFMANTVNLEPVMNGKGFVTAVEIDGTMVFATSGTTATAQAGAASTITLVSSASATDGFYNQQYIYIQSGTGAGQRGLITGYVGSTKVATVSTAWGVVPDNTSVYVLGWSPVTSMATAVTGSGYMPKITIAGQRTSHLVRIYSTNPLQQINVDSSGSIWRPTQFVRPRMFFVADSFGNTNSETPGTNYMALMAKHLGFEPWFVNSGATGIIANNTNTKLTYAQRTVPPVNAWYVNNGQATGGSFTLTQSGITSGAINYNDAIATVQATLDSAFGAGNFYAVIPNAVDGIRLILIGTGSYATSTATLTIASSLTGTAFTPSVYQYKGDIIPNLQQDKAGNVLPCVIFVQGSVNDVGQSSLQTAASTLYTALNTTFPTCSVIAGGIMMSAGPQAGSQLTAELAMEAAAPSLALINGQNPFIHTFNSSTGVGYLNGSTTIKAPSGTAGITTDFYVANDAIHPTGEGHFYIDDVLTSQVNTILRVPQ